MPLTVPNTWLPNLPDVNVPNPLPLVWNGVQWGVNVGEQFIPYPIPLPAPQG